MGTTEVENKAVKNKYFSAVKKIQRHYSHAHIPVSACLAQEVLRNLHRSYQSS